jgi:hypothetical protein
MAPVEIDNTATKQNMEPGIIMFSLNPALALPVYEEICVHQRASAFIRGKILSSLHRTVRYPRPGFEVHACCNKRAFTATPR